MVTYVVTNIATDLSPLHMVTCVVTNTDLSPLHGDVCSH